MIIVWIILGIIGLMVSGGLVILIQDMQYYKKKDKEEEKTRILKTLKRVYDY